MRKFRIFTRILILLVSILIASVLYFNFYKQSEYKSEKRCLEEILESGRLVVAMNANFIDFYIYNGRPMGFQLEILEHLVRDFNLELDIIIENDPNKALELLETRKCDIIAQSNENSIEKSLIVDHTLPLRQTKLVLVQRKPDNWYYLTNKQINDSLILNLNDIANRDIYVKKGYINTKLLRYKVNNLIKNIHIREIDSLEIEDILRKVSDNQIDLTICDYDFAKVFRNCYRNLHIETEVSIAKNICWQTRPESNVLTDSLNSWISRFKQKEHYEKIYNRYLRSSRNICEEYTNYYFGKNGKISDYDDLFRKHSRSLNWDWLLLASLSYEESRFNPHALSYSGAFGVMQIMPFIYHKFSDKTKINDVDNQIFASVMLLSKLYDKLPEELSDSVSKVKFVISAYNAGYGHLQDAFNLSEKYAKNINSWEDVSFYLSNLSNPKYYTDSVVRNGPFYGRTTVNYTNAIVNRYKLYKTFSQD